MVKMLGTGPALVLYAWLHKVMGSSSGYDRVYIHKLTEGERCVSATHEQIAAETGLAVRKVKRGMSVLRTAGLIENPSGGRSFIRLISVGLAND
jgi:transcription initiation factor IIE alpha subunit